MEKEKSELRKTKSGAVWVSKMELSDYINYSGISSNFFNRTPAWILQRLSGYEVNGKKATFSESEYKELSKAYRKIAEMLIKNADFIESAPIKE
jgi:hypothetical protein